MTTTRDPKIDPQANDRIRKGRDVLWVHYVEDGIVHLSIQVAPTRGFLNHSMPIERWRAECEGDDVKVEIVGGAAP